jgi:signal transduction histidine kinase
VPTKEFLIILLGISGLLTIITLAISLYFNTEKIRQLRAQADKLNRSLNEMDEQAKLIVRTDMELNKTQEELDKKIIGLYALQRLSRAIITTLEEKQIFKMVDTAYLKDLGFEKACGFLWSEKEKGFILHLNIGYSEDGLNNIRPFVNSDKALYLNLIKRVETLSSISASEYAVIKERIKHIFQVASFVVSPVLPQEGDKGFLFVGTENTDVAITEGDEELITILTNQIGQALENARLFEKTWKAHQELEKNVEERTRELTEALEKVKLISKRKTDFISAVSHELRTPLTSVKGYASILLTGKLGDLPSEIRERLEKVNRHTDELVHLVNDLLDIARIESGKIIMKKESLDLKLILERISDLLSVQLKERRIGFSYHIGEGAGVIFADKSQIERVFINLVGNAIKFTPPQGKITIDTHKFDKGVQIDVIDTGCGIPEDAKEAIFEEFYRVDNAINQEAKGTGLGLSLVKHIIEAHDGKIWVTSKLNAGSTFSFTIPQTA